MSNKHIYKNTLFLYIRMFVMMVISLFSSRVILQTLGSNDYGLYNVVGGFIAFFFFFSNSLSLACERFMAYAIGIGDWVLKKKVYSISIILFIALSSALIIIGAISGIPVIKYCLNIPAGREQVAVYVFLWSLTNGALTFLRVPFNAAIIAYERMSFYSWISIIESVLKLILLYGLCIFDYDKLLLFAVMQTALTLLITSTYILYCHINFHDFTKYDLLDKKLIKQLFSYVGWNVFGGVADLTISHGLTIILNLFFGTIINAAQSIASQIRNQISGFVNNINLASGPAITKYYAADDKENCKKLFLIISKLDYLMLLIICVPVIFTISQILDLWFGRGVYPQETVELTILVLVNSLIDTLSGCSQSIVNSSGKIKQYQIVLSLLKLFGVIFVYFALLAYTTPFVAYWVLIIFSVPKFVYQIYISSKLLTIKYTEYLNAVLKPNLFISLIVFVASYCISRLHISSYEIMDFLAKVTFYLLFAILVAFFMGFTKEEKKKICFTIKNKFAK